MRRPRAFRPTLDGLAPRLAPSGLTASPVTIADETPTTVGGEQQPAVDGGYAPGLGGNASASTAPPGILGD